MNSAVIFNKILVYCGKITYAKRKYPHKGNTMNSIILENTDFIFLFADNSKKQCKQ
jgi:hypothetical protein